MQISVQIEIPFPKVCSSQAVRRDGIAQSHFTSKNQNSVICHTLNPDTKKILKTSEQMQAFSFVLSSHFLISVQPPTRRSQVQTFYLSLLSLFLSSVCQRVYIYWLQVRHNKHHLHNSILYTSYLDKNKIPIKLKTTSKLLSYTFKNFGTNTDWIF